MVLGICAGLLWTAQGSLMLAYPTEGQKGMFIGIFWSIFNLGGVVGAAVSLGNNFDNTVRTFDPAPRLPALLTLITAHSPIPVSTASADRPVNSVYSSGLLRSPRPQSPTAHTYAQPPLRPP